MWGDWNPLVRVNATNTCTTHCSSFRSTVTAMSVYCLALFTATKDWKNPTDPIEEWASQNWLPSRGKQETVGTAAGLDES